MSVRALLRATETSLRTLLGDSDGRTVAVRPPPGKPAPFVGQTFYAVWYGGCKARRDHTEIEYTDVDHTLTVTITSRQGYSPDDRRGRTIDTNDGSLLALAEALAVPGVIHGNYTLMNAANALIPGTAAYVAASADPEDVATVNGFIEPLWLLDYGPEKQQGPEWVGAKEGKDVWSIDVRFGLARRITVGG